MAVSLSGGGRDPSLGLSESLESTGGRAQEEGELLRGWGQYVDEKLQVFC